jgi:hypothetical protein
MLTLRVYDDFCRAQSERMHHAVVQSIPRDLAFIVDTIGLE